MKKNISYFIVVFFCLFLAGCDHLLDLDSETKITTNYLYLSKEGLQRAVIVLYVAERDKVVDDSNDKSIVYLLQTFDFSTDIILFRAGNCARVARLDQLNADSPEVSDFWNFHYFLIGKANEIIESAEHLGLEDKDIKAIYGEAKLFRGRSFFELWKRFERIYLNTEAVRQDNLNRHYTPATREKVFEVIKDDLDEAIRCLDWAIPTYNDKVMFGRFTKAVAKHVRAQVAMWEEDWNEAITQCEDILIRDGKAYYGLEKNTETVFSSENLRSKEVLFAYQFSKNVGGGGTVSGSTLKGHPVSVYVTSQYRSMSGCIADSKYGGYGFGRVYPNQHLFSLYSDKDTRKEKLFIHSFKYNDPNSPKFGQTIEPVDAGTNYCRNLHPMSIKHADFWTNQDLPTRQSSFRDLIVYRLAETSLMCAEAYFHKGENTPALTYYNMTYERAGNSAFTGTLTLDDILAEYARELHFEGVRWPLLKRLCLLYDYCTKWSGESMTENPYLDKNYIEARQNFIKGKHDKWPIPSDQILLMGPENFPQTNVWN